jgi:hypothetical protein
LAVSIIYGYYEKLVKEKKAGNQKEEVYWENTKFYCLDKSHLY